MQLSTLTVVHLIFVQTKCRLIFVIKSVFAEAQGTGMIGECGNMRRWCSGIILEHVNLPRGI